MLCVTGKNCVMGMHCETGMHCAEGMNCGLGAAEWACPMWQASTE